jgi:hypothetical protein
LPKTEHPRVVREGEMDRYFSVPFYKELTNPDGWENTCGKNRRYQAVRAIFKISTSQLPGPGKIGRKFSVFGAPEGISQEVFKSVELGPVDIHLEAMMTAARCQLAA